MTTETRTYISVGDILAIEIVCSNCGASATRPIAKSQTLPTRCTNCGADFFDPEETALKALETVLDRLSLLNRLELNERSRFSLRIQLAESPKKSTSS